MPTPKHYVVVVEWSNDGSVGTNGPYTRREDAIRAARHLSVELARDEDRTALATDDGAVVFDPEMGPLNDDNKIDLSVQPMGLPVEVPTLKPTGA